MHLPTVLIWRLAESPASYEHLLRWVRCQWHVLPDAVGMTLCGLKRDGWVEIDEDSRRWRVRSDCRATR